MGTFNHNEIPAYGYDAEQCLLELQAGDYQPYSASRNDFYWKIGITLRNLDHAVAYLQQQGWPVSEPRQFRDIGYMCHLQDPQGFNIELLQQNFQGKEIPISSDSSHPIGSQAIFAHITLRVTDIDAAKRYCEETLGMRLLSIQPVDNFGFCLYFYGWSNEILPHPDLQSVSNREWLWQRPYALLELQHLHNADTTLICKPDAHTAGFAGFAYAADDTSLTYLALSDLQQLI